MFCATSIGYALGGWIGLGIGALLGAFLIALFWVAVVVLAAGEVGNLLRGRGR